MDHANIEIRAEAAEDTEAIHRLTKIAFANAKFSSHTEHFIVDALRKAGELTISLVAVTVDGRVVGHVAMSPVIISSGTKDWYGLGPVSVAPDQQRKGIGSALVKEALTRLRTLGGHGCVLLGDPAFYSRFGFSNQSSLEYLSAPREHFQALSFDAYMPAGSIQFQPAFDAKG
jgi:predicted N-acetyltransferase YhbS